MKYKFYIILLLIGFIVNAQKKWTLEECINHAIEHNLNIKQNELSQKIQQENIFVQKWEKYPVVNSFAGTTYNFGFQTNLNGTNEIAQSFATNLGLNSQIILYNKGTLKMNLEKSKLEFETIQWINEKAKTDLTLQITQNYLTILLNYELKNIAEKSKEISLQNLTRSESLFKLGKISISNLAEVKATYADDNQVFENAKINIERSRFNLSQLLLLDDYKDFDVEFVNLPEQINDELIDLNEIIQYSYENQPRIKEYKTRISNSELDLKIAKNSFYPKISAGYSFGMSYLDFLERKDLNIPTQFWNNQNHRIGIDISMPIFSKYQNQARIEKAKITIETQKLGLEQEKIALKQIIQSAYFDISATMQNYKAQIESVKSYQTAIDFTKKSFEAGFISIYDYTISRNNLLIAESRVLQTKYDLVFKRKILKFYAGEQINF